MDESAASLVIGPRQAGKSTLMWQTISNQPSPVLYCNCEEPSIRELCLSPALFIQDIERLAPQANGLFFDEIQHLTEAGLFLKGLIDLKTEMTILATGSSSYHLRSKTRESLAGRARRYQLLPFSLAEVLPSDRSLIVQRMETETVLEESLLWGGYPEVFLSRDKENVLGRLVEAFVLREASDLYAIKNPQAFRRLLSLVASQVGDLVNLSNWSEILGVSVNTVGQYLSILEEGHIIRLVRPYVGGKRAEITSRPKVYFIDNGLRNFLFGGFAPLQTRPDRGKLVENYVFSELCKYTNPLLDAIYFWRSKSQAEVDFVLLRGNEMVVVEAKSAALKKPRLTRSLQSFIQAYSPPKVIVVNAALQEELWFHDTKVIFVLMQDIKSLLGQ
ncbi:MAG: ATP-binding protein [Thermodesulfobacteriota bacterium]|nr:ATP-binding protein [Thermodesulfobacteriota bacterium]